MRKSVAAVGATVASALLGGSAAAVVGAVTVTGFFVYKDFPVEAPVLSEIVALGMMLTFAVGALLAPALTWIGLRHVPLWRASTEIGVVGAIAFIIGLISQSDMWAAALSALVATELATMRLRFASLPRRKLDRLRAGPATN
jgi:hypothetical protein